MLPKSSAPNKCHLGVEKRGQEKEEKEGINFLQVGSTTTHSMRWTSTCGSCYHISKTTIENNFEMVKLGNLIGIES